MSIGSRSDGDLSPWSERWLWPTMALCLELVGNQNANAPPQPLVERRPRDAPTGLSHRRRSASRAPPRPCVEQPVNQPPDAELSVALEHLEQTLDDLSQGMARMSHVIGEEDTASGGLAWRLETLRHALQAARHVCSHARAVAPRSDNDRGGSMLQAEEPSAA
jgi:hypothetical protein